MQELLFSEFEILAAKSKNVAVFKEISTEGLTAVNIYALLNRHYKTDGAIFEDLRPEGNKKRYSHICFFPISSVEMGNNYNENPLNRLRHLKEEHTFITREEVAPFITHAIGFFTYDSIRYFESIPDRHTMDSSLPNVYFNFYSLSLCFDHQKNTILISIIVETTKAKEDFKIIYRQTQIKLAEIIELLSVKPEKMISFINPNKKSVSSKNPATAVATDTHDADFIIMIEKAKDYIYRGDAFQIVLSRCFKRPYSVNSLLIYQTLCQLNPSPYMFYFPTSTCVILGASPEKQVTVKQQQVIVNPIAGTHRHLPQITDKMIENSLLVDEKELAEHTMLVDLARNDVGSVSIPGTVQIDELRQVKHFSHISHMTSTVIGELHEKHDIFDAFAATFPAGTLSGAPKIRAMEIIDELENSRRGLYGGAICRLDALGNFESCIAIRMALLKNGEATIRTGAGIVHDSIPKNEVDETYQKAKAMLNAIAQAHNEEMKI